jgi:hypothetical protein
MTANCIEWKDLRRYLFNDENFDRIPFSINARLRREGRQGGELKLMLIVFSLDNNISTNLLIW